MAIDLRTIGSFTILLLAATALADSPESNESVVETPKDPAASKEKNADLAFIDEVIVVEQKSIGQLRYELFKADDQVFSLYNDLNTNDSLDMICKKETRIGSQIKYRVCKSSYHRQIESESASDFLEYGDVSTSARAPAGHYDKIRSNMADLMSQHPELLKAVRRRAMLRKKIAEQKEKE